MVGGTTANYQGGDLGGSEGDRGGVTEITLLCYFQQETFWCPLPFVRCSHKRYRPDFVSVSIVGSPSPSPAPLDHEQGGTMTFVRTSHKSQHAPTQGGTAKVKQYSRLSGAVVTDVLMSAQQCRKRRVTDKVTNVTTHPRVQGDVSPMMC